MNKRSDGFHNIESLFYPLALTDALECIPSPNGKFRFTCSGIAIPGKESENICTKAYNLIKKHHPVPEVHMHLHKVVPIGSGLGGGSSDGAYTLKLLNKLFELQLSDTQLESYAARLGSDCPFFIRNKPVMVRGRGEVFTSVNLNLTGYYVVLVKPNIQIQTRYAYTLVTPRVQQHGVQECVGQPPEKWKEMLFNAFELPIIRNYPEIGILKHELYKAGALYASMTGSGSAVYGLFDHQVDIRPAFNRTFVWQGSL